MKFVNLPVAATLCVTQACDEGLDSYSPHPTCCFILDNQGKTCVQGSSVRQPSGLAGNAASVPSSPSAAPNISRLSAPVGTAKPSHEPLMSRLQSAMSAAQGSAVVETALTGHAAATAQKANAVHASVTAANRHQQSLARGQPQAGNNRHQHSPARGQPQVGSSMHQQPAADSTNNTYQAVATADRPLSSFAQKADHPGSARQAGAVSRAAADRTGAHLHSQQPDSEAAATASTALGAAHAEQKSSRDGVSASAAAMGGSPLPEPSGFLELQQEGYATEPSFEANLVPISPQSGRPREASSKIDISQNLRFDASPQSALVQMAARADLAQQPSAMQGGNNSQADASCGLYVEPGHNAAMAPGEAAAGTSLPASAGLQRLELLAAGAHQPGATLTIAAAKAEGAGGTADTASPSSFGGSLLGQSVDLSKVNVVCSSFESILQIGITHFLQQHHVSGLLSSLCQHFGEASPCFAICQQYQLRILLVAIPWMQHSSLVSLILTLLEADFVCKQHSQRDDLQAPFTVSQMRKFADKLRNFSTTPTPESKPSGGQGHRHRRHSTLSASTSRITAAHSSAAHDSTAATPESSWAGSSLSPEIAPQRLLGQFGNTPQPQSSAKKGYASKYHCTNQSEAAASALPATEPAVARPEPTATGSATAAADLDAAVATAGLRQGSEGQMMLLPKGVGMNDLLALADEIDPSSSPSKTGQRDKRMLTADSTMQLAAYLANKVTHGHECLSCCLCSISPCHCRK